MSNRVIEALLRLSAQNRTDMAFKAVARNFDGLSRRAATFNRQQTAMYRTTAAASRAANAAMLRYAAPAAIAYGATKAFTANASLQRQLTQIGITAGASASEMEAAMGKIYKIADDVGTPVGNVIEQLDTMVATGRTLDEAMGQLPLLSKTAQTYAADFNDLGITFDVLAGSLGIVGKEAGAAMDIIAAGGKEGKFELKDMAAELPSMVPAFAALGYSGLDGLKKLTALLQIVRKDTGTSAEAATNLNDVFQKMESLTVFNNFKRFGIDIRKELKRARDNGEDVMDAFIRLAREAIHGDLSKLPQLFTDKQMLGGMRSLINRTAELEEMQGKLGDTLGTVNEDFKRVSDDAVANIDRMKNAWSEMTQEIGSLVAPAASAGMDFVTDDIKGSSAIIKALRAEGKDWLGIANWLADNATNPLERHKMALKGGWAPGMEGFTADGLIPGDLTARFNSARELPPYKYPIPRERPKPRRGAEPQVLLPGTSRLNGNPPRYGLDPKLDYLYSPIEEKLMKGSSMNVLQEAERKLNIGSESIAQGGADAGKAMEEGGKAASDALKEAAAALRQAAREAMLNAARERALGRDVSGPGDL